MQLSDIDIVNLEAELETDLATRIDQNDDAQSSLELDSLRVSLNADNDDEDDDNQLKNFSLLANARESIQSIRQASSELVQNINDELLESRNDAASNTTTISDGQSEHTVQEEKVQLRPTEEDTFFSLTQIPSSTTNNDVVDQSESETSPDCEIDDCDSDAATNDCCETDAAAEYHDQYLDQTSSAVDESFEQATTEANEQLRMIEEKHRMKRLILEQRKEHIRRRTTSVKRLQRWWQRINTRRQLLLASIISSLTSNTIQSAVKDGLSQCTMVLESTIECSIILRSSRDLSIPQTRQMMNWDDLNCRHIMVIRDPINYKVHIFILYQRHLKHYAVCLRRRLTGRGTKDSSPTLLLGNRLYDLIPRQDDSETKFSQFTRQALPIIYHEGIQPLLLPNLSPRLMLEDGPALDLTPLCLILCKISQRVMTRRALRTMQCLKAAVRIQSIYRGFIVRRRVDSVHCSTFDYIDNELDNILGGNISKDMLQFDEEDEEDSKWNPCRPYIEPTVHCSNDDNDIRTSESDTKIPKPKPEPLHRVLLSTSRVQHNNESEDTTSRRKATPKIVKRNHLKERESESYTTWQKMKVKDIRVAQVSEYVYLVCVSFM